MLDPQIPSPLPELDDSASDESPAFIHHVHHWLKSLRAKNNVPPDRVFRALVPKMSGDHVFVPRFLHPSGQNPPQEQDDFQWTPSNLARFVSLIPFLNDFQVRNSPAKRSRLFL